MDDAIKNYFVDPGTKLKLSKIDASDTSCFPKGKKAALKKIKKLSEQIEEMQELLYAEKKHRLLVVLQGMDTSGKDGTIRHVFEGVNPQGVKVASFKKPTQLELDHDFLWRIHPHVPAKGEIVIFNRSHYEDVVVVRVHKLVSKEQIKKRYDHINAFEKMLYDEGTTILKFYLHIDKDEQKARLLARKNDKAKQWKLSENDVPERQLWDDYIEAYEDAIKKTSQKHAPWFVIPANHKWYRNYLISKIILHTLTKMDIKTPEPSFDVSKLEII
ncbi:MAG: polyphosphate kinase 2 family protein [Candidatus Nanoarchaeia archaeon]